MYAARVRVAVSLCSAMEAAASGQARLVISIINGNEHTATLAGPIQDELKFAESPTWRMQPSNLPQLPR